MRSAKSLKAKGKYLQNVVLQKIIDLLGVKYRNRFPMFTNDGGRANVAQSKLMQESDQGSFVTDTKAGNQIWIPKDVNNLSDQEIQDIVDNFVQGRETQYKSLKNDSGCHPFAPPNNQILFLSSVHKPTSRRLDGLLPFILTFKKTGAFVMF